MQRRVVSAALAVSALLLTAGCSSDGGGSPGDGTSTSSDSGGTATGASPSAQAAEQTPPAKGTVKVLPFNGQLNDKYTVVATQVNTSDNKTISVNYVFHKTADGQWKAYDVIIEGISYITNYRNQVDAQIKKEGLDKLTQDLETQGDQALKAMEQDNKANGAK